MSLPSKSSFSPRRRWRIGFDLALRTLLVLAVVAMVNVLGAKFVRHFYLSSQTNAGLSTRTLTILHSLTNRMTITLYYDTHDQENFYPTLYALANAYHDANKNISVQVVDYISDPGEAAKVKEQYHLPGAANSPNAPPAKDLIIFACGDRHDIVPGAAIVNYQTVPLETNNSSYDPNASRWQFRKKPVQFNGEMMFTSKIFSLAHAQPLKAYFLQGDGESSLADGTDDGFTKFGLALIQNDFTVNTLELFGDADVPSDCNLLVIAGPAKPLLQPELQKIDRYLAQGGKLLVLFNYATVQQPTGLEPILQRWGINVIGGYITDPDNSMGNNQVVVVSRFNPKSFVNPLTQLALEMVLPRPVEKVNWNNPPANAPFVNELVFSGDHSTLATDAAATPRSYSLIATSQQKPGGDATNPRGDTRIVVAGDSLFLDNQLIDAAANRDFLNYAVNWLVDRQELLSGIGPRPVTEYRLLLSRKEQQQLSWLLLGALPGGILLLGWLVWLARRK